jgi:hypothetical protein
MEVRRLCLKSCLAVCSCEFLLSSIPISEFICTFRRNCFGSMGLWGVGRVLSQLLLQISWEKWSASVLLCSSIATLRRGADLWHVCFVSWI